MKPLKICMVTTFYPPYNFGGDGIYVYRLTNALARHGHEVHVIHDLDAFALLTDHLPKASYPNHPNVIIYPLTSKGVGPLDLTLQHQLGRPVLKRQQIKIILENTDFDVIHFHNISLVGGPHVLRYGGHGKSASAVKLVTLHDYWFVCATHVLWRFDQAACTQRTCLACTLAAHRPPQLWRYTGSVARAVTHVDAFIGPSRSAGKIHHDNGFPAPIRHLPHFLPDSELTPDGAELEYPPTRPYVLYVGRLEKIKGVQILIDLFRTYDQLDLIIAGTGTYEPDLRAMAEGLAHVRFVGFLGHHQLQILYQKALVAVVPSICYETFGWVTLEAFSVHTPVIVNNIGALPEIVQAGGGFVYNTPDELLAAIERLRTEPGLRDELGEQGYQNFVAHHTEDAHLKMYFDLIAELQAARTGNKTPEAVTL